MARADRSELASPDIGGFTKLPNRFFGSGMAADLGPSASLIYVALCDHANRKGTNPFKVSDRALSADTAIAERTISNARKKLLKAGLIDCSQQQGKSCEYTLKKLALAWKPEKDRLRARKMPRAGRHQAPDSNELFEERAAIVEFDGRVSRGEAEELTNQQRRRGNRPRERMRSSVFPRSAAKFAAL